ncbi:MAG: exosome complex protein Rrp42 [Candidatus Micrarchaeaceae archaeon]
MQLITNKFLNERIALGKRDDNRDPMSYRNISFELNEIPNAEGSALVKLGNTKVLTGIKIDLSEPMKDTPNDGNITTSAELLPMADDSYDVGPPTPFGIEFARVVDRAIRAAGVIDTEKLFIEEGKVWSVFVDMYVLNNDGNLFDAGLLSSMAALLTCKLPKYEDQKVIREAMGKLPTKNITTSCTFVKFSKKLLLDPTANEEALADSRVTIGNDENVIRSMQKGMSGSFIVKDLDQLIDMTFDKSKILREILKKNTGV